MLVPPLLAAILVLLAAALVCRSILSLPVAAVLVLGDAALASMKIRRQTLPLPYFKVLAARVRAVGSLGYYLGYHLLRYYLVLMLLVLLAYPPFGLLILMILLGVGFVDFRVRKAKLPLVLFYCYYFCEQLSYGSGVFCGCLRTKSFASYRLDLKGAAGRL